MPSYVADSQVDNISQEGTRPSPAVRTLNAEADDFEPRDYSRIHPSRVGVSLRDDELHVRQVQAGGVGIHDPSAASTWNTVLDPVSGHRKEARIVWSASDMPYNGVDSLPDLSGTAPKQVQSVKKLQDFQVKLPKGTFIDKVLPGTEFQLEMNEIFTPNQTGGG